MRLLNCININVAHNFVNNCIPNAHNGWFLGGSQSFNVSFGYKLINHTSAFSVTTCLQWEGVSHILYITFYFNSCSCPADYFQCLFFLLLWTDMIQLSWWTGLTCSWRIEKRTKRAKVNQSHCLKGFSRSSCHIA